MTDAIYGSKNERQTKEPLHAAFCSAAFRCPSFLSSSSGIRSQIASGNIDVAPTVLELLGIPVPTHMEGRILTEALVGGTAPIVPASTNSSEQSPIVRTATTGEKTYVCEFG